MQPVFNFQGSAILSMMALLGTVLVLGSAGAGLMVLLLRGKLYAARWVAMAAGVIGAAYLAVLAGFSAASRAQVVEPGQEKYFCELDCHLAYSVAGVERTPMLGNARAKGAWHVVRLKVRFDPTTISPGRGDAFLYPNPRAVRLIGEDGNSYAPSAPGLRELEAISGAQKRLDAPLRPGEAYTAALVFDVPGSAGALRLAVDEASPQTRLLIGHENSLFHHGTTFRLDAPSPAASAETGR
jgi:hypothetical protein